jgi:hypothetical protein
VNRSHSPPSPAHPTVPIPTSKSLAELFIYGGWGLFSLSPLSPSPTRSLL